MREQDICGGSWTAKGIISRGRTLEQMLTDTKPTQKAWVRRGSTSRSRRRDEPSQIHYHEDVHYHCCGRRDKGCKCWHRRGRSLERASSTLSSLSSPRRDLRRGSYSDYSYSTMPRFTRAERWARETAPEFLPPRPRARSRSVASFAPVETTPAMRGKKERYLRDYSRPRSRAASVDYTTSSLTRHEGYKDRSPHRQHRSRRRREFVEEDRSPSRRRRHSRARSVGTGRSASLAGRPVYGDDANDYDDAPRQPALPAARPSQPPAFIPAGKYPPAGASLVRNSPMMGGPGLASMAQMSPQYPPSPPPPIYA